MLCVHKAAVVYLAGWGARAPRVWQPCPSKSLSCLQLVEASWTPPVGDKQEVKAQVFRGSSQRTVDENPTVRLWLWCSGAAIAGADWCESQAKFDVWRSSFDLNCVSVTYIHCHTDRITVPQSWRQHVMSRLLKFSQQGEQPLMWFQIAW